MEILWDVRVHSATGTPPSPAREDVPTGKKVFDGCGSRDTDGVDGSDAEIV